MTNREMEDRRKSDKAWREAILSRFVEQAALYTKLSERVEDLAKSTAALVELQRDGESAMRFFCRLAKVWRFILHYVILPLGSVGAAGYWFFHDYTMPALNAVGILK
jgi:hypothetical protein